MLRKSFKLLVLCFGLSASFAHAVDKDDFYANFYGGYRFDDRAQGGITFGYAPFNAVGIGLVVDGTHSIAQVSIEPRWFLEPFEFATALGVSRGHAEGTDGQTRFLFSAAVAYLWALTPSIALRGELRGQYLIDGPSSALLSAGARLVF